MASQFASVIQSSGTASSKMSGNNKPEHTVVEGEWSDWKTVSRCAKNFDLIEINRRNGVYQHWVMYLSEGYVIHVTQVDGRTEGDQAEKRVDTLKKIAGDDQCRINNLKAVAKAKGLHVRTDEEIYKSIEDIVGVEGDYELKALSDNHYKLMPYNVYSQNCEYYVTGWKYGKQFSMQIENKIEAFKRGEIPPEVMQVSIQGQEQQTLPGNTIVFKKKKTVGIGSIMPRDR